MKQEKELVAEAAEKMRRENSQFMHAVAAVLESVVKDADRRIESINRMIPTAKVNEVTIAKEPVQLARLYLDSLEKNDQSNLV